jgi:hypothetical protein
MIASNSFVSNDGMIWPGMSVKRPLRRCVPGRDYECLAGYLPRWTDEYFNKVTIKYVEDNYNWDGYDVPYEQQLHKWPMSSTATTAYHGCDPGYPACSPDDPGTSYCPQCIPIPNVNFCYKVHVNDTIHDLAARFHVDEGKLCELNQMKNCSCLSTEGSWLKIQYSQADAAPEN